MTLTVGRVRCALYAKDFRPPLTARCILPTHKEEECVYPGNIHRNNRAMGQSHRSFK